MNINIYSVHLNTADCTACHTTHKSHHKSHHTLVTPQVTPHNMNTHTHTRSTSTFVLQLHVLSPKYVIRITLQLQLQVLSCKSSHKPSRTDPQEMRLCPKHAGHLLVDHTRRNEYHSCSTWTTCCWLERTRSSKKSSLN